MTISVRICGCVLFFDTWCLLQRRRLGVQHSRIYVILAIMMASLVFYTTVAAVVEFCVSRVAVSSSEKYGHKSNEAGPSDRQTLNNFYLNCQMGS